MNRVLVAHSSRRRRTSEVAEALGARLRMRGLEVEIANAREGRLPPPQDYDAVILGAGIWRARPLVAYEREHKDALEQMPTGVFSVRVGRHFQDAELHKLADLVAVSLRKAMIAELDPAMGPLS